VSAVTEFPDSPSSVQTIDMTPGNSKVDTRWTTDLRIQEGYILEWDVESSIPVTVFALDQRTYHTIYEDKIVNRSSHTLTFNETTYVRFGSVESSGATYELKFHYLRMTAPLVDLSNYTLWEHQGSFSKEAVDPSCRYLVVEPSKPNITAQDFRATRIEYEGKTLQAVMTHKASLVLLIAFVIFVILEIIFMIIDVTGAIDLWLCYIFYKSDSGYNRINSSSDENSPLVA